MFQNWLEKKYFTANIARADKFVRSNFIGLDFLVSKHVRHLCIEVQLNDFDHALGLPKLVCDLVFVLGLIEVKAFLTVDLAIAFDGDNKLPGKDLSEADKLARAQQIITSFLDDFQRASAADLDHVTIHVKATSGQLDRGPNLIVPKTDHISSEWSTMRQQSIDHACFLTTAIARSAKRHKKQDEAAADEVNAAR
jgi:hypothetical protein